MIIGVDVCKTCRFWDSAIKGGEPVLVMKSVAEGEKETVMAGLCRLHSPFGSGFPSTREDDWCGDWQKRQGEKPEHFKKS